VEDVRLQLDQQSLGQHTDHAYSRLYPSLHLAYDLGSGRQLTASFSRRVNVPYSEQLDPLPLSQSPILLTAGNPDLRPEDAYSYELAYEDRHGDQSQTATLFYRETRDAFTSLSAEQPGAVILETTANAGGVRRAGGELAVGGKLTPKLSYNFSLDAYWIELNATNLGIGRAQSIVTGFGRASLNWQVTPKDFLQLNLFSTAKDLLPQGYAGPSYAGNVGYRHTINTRASWMLVVDDPLNTERRRRVETLNGIVHRHLETQSSQSMSLALVWSFAGKPKDTGFDFASRGEAR
jgi:outer membrane receptor protein involved in Fe transport